MIEIFIDESGNLGKKDRYFIIAALVPSNKNRLKNIIKTACLSFAPAGLKALPEIKGSLLAFVERQELLAKLSSVDDFHCFYIAGDKHHIEPKILEDNNLCFNYLMGYLVKMIIRRLDLENNPQDIYFYLDNRNLKVASVNSLPEYLKIKLYSETNFKGDIKFIFCDSKRFRAIQMVDVLANTIYRRYTYGRAQNHLYKLIGVKPANYVHFPNNQFGK